MNQLCSSCSSLSSELSDALLNARARLPERLVRFVATDVDELTREERHHFGEHVLHEADGGFVGVQDVRVHAPSHAHVRRLARHAELRIGGDRGERVTRASRSRDDVHESIARVGDDLANIVLRVEAAVTLSVVLPRRGVAALLMPDDRLRPPRADLA